MNLSDKKKIVLSVVSGLIFLAFLFFVGAQTEKEMTVEADIIGETVNASGSEISIEIPDYVFLGNVTPGRISDEKSVVIRNTGTNNTRVIAELIDPDDRFFKYAQLTNGTSSTFRLINDFSTSVTRSRTRTIKIRLDLRNFEEDLEEDLIGYKSKIRFIAMGS